MQKLQMLVIMESKVKKSRQKQSGSNSTLLLLSLCCLLILSTLTVEAKTHHSKRQATPTSSGRENTNWWNLWWQQYISEAAPVTVRPIVGVSFNGKSIKLGDDENGAQQLPDFVGSSSSNVANYKSSSEAARDVETNFVLSKNLPNNMHPQVAKQMILSQRKSTQQANWQSVRPTMIQPSRDARQNRQAQEEEPSNQRFQAGQNLGIQMRNSMNLARSNSRNMIQQQQRNLDEARFEQQQQQLNQMLDYSDEAEPELDQQLNSMDDRQRGSDSASMMQPEEPRTTSTTRAQQVPDANSMRNQPASDATPTRAQPDSTTKARKEQPKSSTTPADSSQTTQRGSNLMPAGGRAEQPMQPRAMSQPMGSTSSSMTTRANNDTLRVTTNSPLAGKDAADEFTTRMQTATSSAPATTTTTESTMTTQTSPSSSSSGGSAEIDINETPISIDSEGQDRMPKVTTPSRVELKNGKPTNVGDNRRQQTASNAQSTQDSTPRTTQQAATTTTTSPPTTTTTVQSKTSQPESSQTATDASVMNTSQPSPTGSSTSIAGNSNNASTEPTTTVSADADDAGDETEEEEDANGNSLSNSAGSDSANGDAEDSSTDSDSSSDDQNEPTTTPASIGSTQTASSESTRMDSSRANQAEVSTTTQQPISTTTDIARIPKGSSSVAEQASSTSSPARDSDQSVRVSQPEGKDQPSAKFVMMTLDQTKGAMDAETAITMPMDTLVRMMMMNQVEQDADRPRTTQAMPTSPNAPSSTSSFDMGSFITSTSSPTTVQQQQQTTTQTPMEITQQPMTSTRKESTVTTEPSNRLTSQSEGESSSTSGQKKKLQPPPTTRIPSMSSNKLSNQVPDSSPVESTNQAKSMLASMMDVNSVGADEETPMREPKLEMVNIDLMPIQRLMSNQMQPNRESDQQEMKMNILMGDREFTRQRPSSESANVDQTTSRDSPSSGLMMQNQQVASGMQEPAVMVAEVEPGMRLRPVTSPARGSTSSPSRMANNQANTVYMIMMNGMPTESHQKKPGQAKNMMMNQQMMRQEFTFTTAQQPTSGPAMRPTKVTMSANLQQSTPATASRGKSMIELERQQMSRMQSTPSRPDSTSSDLTTQTKSMSTSTTPSQESTTAFQSTETTSSPLERLTTTKQQPVESPMTTMRQAASQTSPRPTTTSQLAQSTTRAPTTSNARNQQQAEAGRSSTTQTPSSTQRPVDFGSTTRQQVAEKPANASSQDDRKPLRLVEPGSTKLSSANKGAAKNLNSTSGSFIPAKLRTDFSTKLARIQQGQPQQSPKVAPSNNDVQTTTQLPMNAIRQFGGSNRMSALANQPVPFGRPSAMVAAPSGGRQATRIEFPTFEYGPSIAVRRPDEPLANGQVPNCTLTGKNFCVLTKDYPMNEVRQAVERSFRSVRIMYEELQTVSDQELHKDDFNTTNNQAASGKFACQTQVEMMRPGWAKDEITKEWMLVVNTDVFPQRVRTESCAQPNTPCEFIAPFYDSTCQQRYSLHRMIAIDPHDPSRSPQVAVFKFPAGCVCRVHPIRKTTMAASSPTTSLAATPAPTTVISVSTSKSIRRR